VVREPEEADVPRHNTRDRVAVFVALLSLGSAAAVASPAIPGGDADTAFVPPIGRTIAAAGGADVQAGSFAWPTDHLEGGPRVLRVAAADAAGVPVSHSPPAAARTAAPPAPSGQDAPAPLPVFPPQSPATALFPPSTVAVGPQEVILSNRKQNPASPYGWPDGTMHVSKAGDTYTFIAAAFGWPQRDSSGFSGMFRTVGTLANPIATSVTPFWMTGYKNPVFPFGGVDAARYIAGGPIYTDHASGMMIMFYHRERWPQGEQRRFYGDLGLARSRDKGITWTDLGVIIEHNHPYPHPAQNIEVGAGPFVIDPSGQYFYVYHIDHQQDDTSHSFCVSRARMTDVLQAADLGGVTAWTKYYDGSFGEPGLGGRCTDRNPNPEPYGYGWYDVKYNAYLGRYVMAGSRRDNLELLASSDGINWTMLERHVESQGHHLYATLVGLGSDPLVLGDQFYVYYVAGLRNDHSYLARRLVTLSGSPVARPLGN
jgi:hypothetical protein